MCVCGHQEVLHEWFWPKGKPGYRRTCSVHVGGRKCTCKRYEEER